MFNLRILSCFPSFRIYRETLSRFSCAASALVLYLFYALIRSEKF
ncbi:potassium-transporting ATPase subunit F [Staphylococcus aureus]